jgi:hypothetical protein
MTQRSPRVTDAGAHENERGVRAAVGVLLDTAAEPDGDPTTVSSMLRNVLVHNGFADAVCEELATFVPLAFSREVLRHVNCAIDYPPYYVAAAMNSPSVTQHLLFDNALYRTAHSIAAQWESDDEKLKIASYSGEYRALTNLIEDATARGAALTQAAVSPPYVVYTELAGQTDVPGLPRRRPWWRFW